MENKIYHTNQTTEYPMAEYLGAEAWKNGCPLFPSATDTHPSPISWEKVVELVQSDSAKSGEWRVESGVAKRSRGGFLLPTTRLPTTTPQSHTRASSRSVTKPTNAISVHFKHPLAAINRSGGTLYHPWVRKLFLSHSTRLSAKWAW